MLSLSSIYKESMLGDNVSSPLVRKLNSSKDNKFWYLLPLKYKLSRSSNILVDKISSSITWYEEGTVLTENTKLSIVSATSSTCCNWNIGEKLVRLDNELVSWKQGTDIVEGDIVVLGVVELRVILNIAVNSKPSTRLTHYVEFGLSRFKEQSY